MKNYHVLLVIYLVSIKLFSASISLSSQPSISFPLSDQGMELISFEEELVSSVEFLDAQSITRAFFSNLLERNHLIADFEKELKNGTYSSFLIENKLLFHPVILDVLQEFPENSPFLLLSSDSRELNAAHASIDVQVGQAIQHNFKQMIEQYMLYHYQIQPRAHLQISLAQVFQYIDMFLPSLLNSYSANSQGIINIVNSVINFARSFRHLKSTAQEVKTNLKEGYGDIVCEYILFYLLGWMEEQVYTKCELEQLKEKISDIFYELSQVYSHIIEFNDRISAYYKNGQYVNLRCVSSVSKYDIFTKKYYSHMYLNKLNLIRISLMLNSYNKKSVVRLIEYLSWDRANLTSHETRLKQQNKIKGIIEKPKIALCDYSKRFLTERAGHLSLSEGMVAYKFNAVRNFLDSLKK